MEKITAHIENEPSPEKIREEFLLGLENNPNFKEITEIPEKEIEKSKGPLREAFRFLKKKAKLAVAVTGLVLGAEYYHEKETPYQYNENVKPTTELLKEEMKHMKETKSNALPEVVIYGNRDPETDMILNYISGKEDLPHEYKVELSKIGFIGWLQDSKAPSLFLASLSGKIEAMDTLEYEKYIASDELKKDLVDIDFAKIFSTKDFDPENYSLDEKSAMIQKADPLMDSRNTEEFVNNEYQDFDFLFNPNTIFKSIPDTFDINIYDAVWEMQAKHGNPKIAHSERVGPQYASYSLNKRAHYNNLEDKLYLPFQMNAHASVGNAIWTFTLEDWIAELSHAKQNEEKPVFFNATYLIDVLRTTAISYKKNITYRTAQLEEYEIPGSIENEAHSVIQKKLEEEFKRRTDKTVKEIDNQFNSGKDASKGEKF